MSDLAGPDEFLTYMIVVAHPDDAEFSAGGTIARLTSEGKRVILIQVTSGNRGTSDRLMTPERMASIREEEQLESAARLGIEETVFLRCGDGDLLPDLQLREKIVRMIREHKPDAIITHDPFRPYALHPDHRAVGLATTDAVYPTARDHLYFAEHIAEGLEPHKTAEIWFSGSDQPDRYIDITESIDRKIYALLAHVSQIGDGEGLAERMRERAAELAKDQQFELAEVFK
nr:PIG-L family deacetylase [Chloroflexota bacterium]